jgi:class 3 adenylate cyclase/tetratricopeptide (TPR) repeat protein
MPCCLSCGADIPGGLAFCGRCGASFATALASRDDERKVVTVLFCDLVGFTASSDRADPEDVLARLRAYHVRLRREIERFGGTVEKFIGDAVMAVFGAPVAHEDDPERAVRAALRILDAIEDLNTVNPALELAVRVGISTGEAVVALGARRQDGEAFVAGDMVNTAARLQEAAPVGGVVVEEPTWRATRQLFHYEPLPAFRTKGKSEAVRMWRVHAPRGHVGVDADQPATTPFVGRDVELIVLQRIYDRTVREATPQLVTIVGEAGIGKTRLVREFRTLIEDQPELVGWRQGRCLPYGEGVTFWALGEVVKGHAGILESEEPAEAAAKLAQAVDQVVLDAAEQEWLKRRLAPLVGLADAEGTGVAKRDEAFTAWRRFLEAIAANGRLVIVFEDLHWADPALLAFIDHIFEWASRARLLVVCTLRPEFIDRGPMSTSSRWNGTTITLPPLSDSDTARLVASLLHEVMLSTETRAALLERAGGNPLYAEQVCGMLADRGTTERHGRMASLGSNAEIAFPESIQALITARLDTLGVQRKALLQDAAVVGKVFWSGALAAMGNRDPAAVRDGLRELARRQFIRPAPTSSVKGEDEYAFWHVLTRDVAYGQLPRAVRARKHKEAADWIERLAGGRVADHAEVLAHHYTSALDLAMAAGAVDYAASLKIAARRFLVLAGNRTITLDIARADGYYRRALEYYPPGDPERATVLVKAADTARELVRLIEAEKLYEEAIADFRARGDFLAAGNAIVQHANILWGRGETASARDSITAAVDLLEREPPSPELASAYTEMARIALMAGQPVKALQEVSKAIALADRLGCDDIRQRALQYRGGARVDRGDLKDGLGDLERAVELGLQLGLGRTTTLAYFNLAAELIILEGPASALQALQAGLALCEQRGMAETASAFRVGILDYLTELGNWDRAMRIADELIVRYREWGGYYGEVIVESRKAHILLHRGEVAKAVLLTERFLPHARRVRDFQVLTDAFPVAALAEFARGNLNGAVRLVEEFYEASRNAPARYRAHVLPELVHICVAAGCLPIARLLVEGLDLHAAYNKHCLVSARAVLTEAQGDLEEAADLYADAAGRWANFGVLLRQAQALLGLGRCQAQLDRPSARERLLEAHAIFTRLLARPLLAETDRWLQRPPPTAREQH